MAEGLVSWGVYLPYWHLEQSAIGAALGTSGGRGSRAVASYDEDTNTLAVEAARRALSTFPSSKIENAVFATVSPAYADKTNATTAHAALGLRRDCGAYDMIGSLRSGWAAFRSASLSGHSAPSLAMLSDIRTGLAGSADESTSGDGAVAFVFAPDGAVAVEVARSSISAEFVDRWRVPGDVQSRVWEERFGETNYVPLSKQAFTDALKFADLTVDQVDYLIVTGLHARSVKALKGSLGVRAESIARDYADVVGNLGIAQFGLELADVLDRAQPGQTIVILQLADGADALVLRTTDDLTTAQQARRDAGLATTEELVAQGRFDLKYGSFLTWRNQMHREPPRRPDPQRPEAPPSRRNEGWKFGFEASQCLECGFRSLPPARVCLRCHSVDKTVAERLAETYGTVATYTIDRLAASMSPPVIGAVIDFDGGGRYRGEMTDVDPAVVHIGTRVEMSFRRLYSADGIANYFWKARPVVEAAVTASAKATTVGSEA